MTALRVSSMSRYCTASDKCHRTSYWVVFLFDNDAVLLVVTGNEDDACFACDDDDDNCWHVAQGGKKYC